MHWVLYIGFTLSQYWNIDHSASSVERTAMCCLVRALGPVKSYLCYRIGCQDFVFNVSLTSRFAHDSKVPHGISSRHCFPSSRFTTDDDRLVLVVSKKNISSCKLTIYFTLFDHVCLLFTWPSVCKPPLLLQIYEGPCLPCSCLSRHEWLHLHRCEAVCMDLQPPV